MTTRTFAALAIILACLLAGCGWSSEASRRQTRTGISESGYPKGQSPDPESPALASQKREKPAGETK